MTSKPWSGLACNSQSYATQRDMFEIFMESVVDEVHFTFVVLIHALRTFANVFYKVLKFIRNTWYKYLQLVATQWTKFDCKQIFLSLIVDFSLLFIFIIIVYSEGFWTLNNYLTGVFNTSRNVLLTNRQYYVLQKVPLLIGQTIKRKILYDTISTPCDWLITD